MSSSGNNPTAATSGSQADPNMVADQVNDSTKAYVKSSIEVLKKEIAEELIEQTKNVQ